MSRFGYGTVTFLVVLVLACGGTGKKPFETTSLPPRPAEPPKVEDVSNVLTEYRQNPVAADEKYKDKWLRIRAEVLDVDRSSITARSQAPGMATFYLEAGQEDKVKTLKPRESHIVVEGWCEGQRGTLLGIRECRIVEISGAGKK
jgi:hypothetical protein